MKTFLIAYGCVAFALAILTAVCAYFEGRSGICKTLVNVLYALTLVGILFGMSVLEGKYGMKILYSTVLAALALALVCLGELTGKKLAKKNDIEE